MAARKKKAAARGKKAAVRGKKVALRAKARPKKAAARRSGEALVYSDVRRELQSSLLRRLR